jgi:hypothetical protein
MQTILSVGNAIAARQINSAVSWSFARPFGARPRMVRHPGSLILCHPRKSKIARTINDGLPSGTAHFVWPLLHFLFIPIHSLHNLCCSFR